MCLGNVVEVLVQVSVFSAVAVGSQVWVTSTDLAQVSVLVLVVIDWGNSWLEGTMVLLLNSAGEAILVVWPCEAVV
jgi:hypothetical protein